MIRFNNDYSAGAHPAVMEKLLKINSGRYPGYGEDPLSYEAADLIRKACSAPDADVHFLTGGTQANALMVTTALRPWQSAVCADSGHINAHEAGSVEHGGHRITALPSKDGKITAAQVEETALGFENNLFRDHVTEPKMVYISSPNELGCLYSRLELSDLSRVCREHGLYLFLDGARLAYGLGASDCDFTLADIAALTDVFYIGGTKCGTLFGEALVITNDELKYGFRNAMKQFGAMLAKGWLIGAQFGALFEGGVYEELGREADRKADRIRAEFAALGITPCAPGNTNQIFYYLDSRLADALSDRFVLEIMEKTADGKVMARICTSWYTSDEDVDALIAAVRNYS
ncbi:MAG: aminotransferase class I/II-fold pyridoxal phosphate-dependent enzyme [Lachnospiraceae bacterium]|nr:aminotransferase class I/II-fold pyridoxal phosphate-dependent enzyme [Lachnospiraceae bacterium]